MDRQDRETRRADLYGNTVLGLACRYYDFGRFKPMLNDFHRAAEEGLYTDVFFFVLEGAVFARGAEERPILGSLRRQYAAALLRDTPMAEGMTDGAMRRAWAQRVLGQPVQDADMAALLEDMAAAAGEPESKLIQRTERLLYTYFRRAAWVGRKRDRSGGVHFVRPNALRALSHDMGGGSGGLQKQTLLGFLQGRTPEPILRRYVEDCFGLSMLTPAELDEAERTLCTGVHKNCRLHFTKGELPKRAPSPGTTTRRTWWRTEWPSAS